MDLKTARDRAKLSQSELAAASGVDQPTISRLETGKYKRPQFETVFKLAKALGIDPRQLQFGDQERVAS